MLDWLEGDMMLESRRCVVEFAMREVGIRARGRSEGGWDSVCAVTTDEIGVAVRNAPAIKTNDWTWAKAASA